MSRRMFTSAQKRNRDRTRKRHDQKQRNRAVGPKQSLAAGLAASEARFDALPKGPHYRAAEDRW